MLFNMGGVFLCQRKDTEICDNQGIHACRLQKCQIFREPLQLVFSRQCVACDIDPYARPVCIFHTADKGIVVKICSGRAHTELSACQIYGVSTVLNGHDKAFIVSGGRKKFKFRMLDWDVCWHNSRTHRRM